MMLDAHVAVGADGVPEVDSQVDSRSGLQFEVLVSVGATQNRYDRCC